MLLVSVSEKKVPATNDPFNFADNSSNAGNTKLKMIETETRMKPDMFDTSIDC